MANVDPARESQEDDSAYDLDLDAPLPDDSVLSLDEYLDMHSAIGNETRFRLLVALVQDGPMSATDLGNRLNLRANNLHYHLDKLVEVGLVQNRKRKTRDSDGLYSYYVASSLGEDLLTHGVEELMRREWEYLDMYGRGNEET